MRGESDRLGGGESHRVCEHCGKSWAGLHCPHDGYQNPCPACGVRPTPVAETDEATPSDELLILQAKVRGWHDRLREDGYGPENRMLIEMREAAVPLAAVSRADIEWAHARLAAPEPSAPPLGLTPPTGETLSPHD